MPATPKVRMTIEFEPEAAERLEKDAESFGGSKSLFIRRAMSVLATLLDARKAGDKIIIRHADGTEDGMVLL